MHQCIYNYYTQSFLLSYIILCGYHLHVSMDSQSFLLSYIILCDYYHLHVSEQTIIFLFRLEKEGGPAHERNFVCSVQVDTKTGTFVTIGDPMSRVKDAENSAAQKMVELLLKL